MKKLYTNLSIGILFLISFTASAQVLITEDFEGTSATNPMPPGWVFQSSPPFESTTVTPCEGARSVRAVISTNNQNAILRSPIQTTTGDDVEVSFAYKIINTSGGTATPTTFGSLQLQYTVNANAATPTWTTYHTIGSSNHTPSTNCATSTQTITGVPSGSDFAWRVRTNWAVGNYHLYIDDFMAVEQVPCIAPFNLAADNINFDSAQISWEDLNNLPQGWEIEYGPVGFPPGFGFGTTVSTTTEPTTLTGLNDGTQYDVYIRVVCGPGNESVWVGPLTFQTIAIGSDCANAFQINNDKLNPVAGDLPFTHTSNTNIYGNDYSGAPGNFCSTTGNYLQGDDVVYEYVSYDDDILQIEVTGTTGNVGVFVYESCANIGVSCFAGETNLSGGTTVNVIDLFVTSGNTYYIVISTSGAGTSTPYTLNITGFNCATWQAPDGDNLYEFYNQTLGDFTGPGFGVNPTITGAYLTWYEDNNGVPGAEITNPNAITLQDNDVYWVKQTIGSCDSPFLEVKFEEFDCLGQLAILTKDETDSACESGQVTLGATGNTTNLLWYDAQFGGDIVGSGNSYTTPVITQTTSYWVSEVFYGEGTTHNHAKPGPTTTQSYTTNNAGVLFTTSSPMTLVSVQVFSTGPGGTITVKLIDGSGNEQVAMVNVPGGGSAANPVPAMLHLNFDIPNPGTYRLLKTSGTGPSMMGSASATTKFPYSIGNVGEVTNGATLSGTSTIYYYFYNWTIRENVPLCESPREEVIATVHDILPITVTATDFSVCVGETTTLTASSTDPDYNYTWTWSGPGGLQTASGASTTVTIVQNTTYTVTGINPNTGCEYQTTIDIEAIGAGEINVTPEVFSTCVGNIVELNAGGIYHTFNEQLTGWTTTNSSTGPAAPANARWKLVSSPFNPANGATSNDSSQFYIAIADAVGPGGTVDTQLISPPFNLVGVQNANLSFYHYYLHAEQQNTLARVQINAGNGWETLVQYGDTGVNCETCTKGTPTNFELVNIDLSNYTGAASVQVRFNYTGKFGWWWAVDNVTIDREYTNGEVTWIGVNDLFLDADATIPYNGSSTNKVYFKSDLPGTFNYTVELDIVGCNQPLTKGVTITVNETQPPTGPAIQDYISGQTLFSLNITGQNLKYYILVNGEYKRISPNTPLIHDTTYYISQTQNDCESLFLEVTANLDCPAPSNLAVTVGMGAGNNNASALITWTRPQQSASIQSFFIEITNVNDPNDKTTKTVSGTNDQTIITGLTLNEDFILEIYSICDPAIPVYSLVETEGFNTKDLSTGDFNFDGFTYYPNPTRDIVTFENLLPMEQMEVYSINGQKVFEQHTINDTRLQVNFSEFASGVYFAKVKVGDAIQVVRIIRE